MHKSKTGRKFGRKRDSRKALLKSLARSLIVYEKITTTEAKAKELRRYIEPMITRARKDSIHARRFIARTLDKQPTQKLFLDIGPRYKDRAGGYTRIIKKISRKADAAKMAVIEFV